MCKKTQLYRHFDSDGVLLYVGISCNVLRRTGEHEGSFWFDNVRNITIESFENRHDAECSERDAINAEKPKYNVDYNWEMRKQNALNDISGPITLKKYTEICGVTPLAKRVGVSISFIWMIAHDKRSPSPKVARRIHKETDRMVSLEELRPDIWGEAA